MKYTTGWTETTKTGPNDARRVVWALGEYFIILLSFFLMLTKDLLYVLVPIMKYVTGWAGTAKTGPNDARCVVWAVCEFILFY